MTHHACEISTSEISTSLGPDLQDVGGRTHHSHERGEGDRVEFEDEGRRAAASRGMRRPADLGVSACARRVRPRRARAKRYACGFSGPGSGSGSPGIGSGVGSGSVIGVGSLIAPPLDSPRACTHAPSEGKLGRALEGSRRKRHSRPVAPSIERPLLGADLQAEGAADVLHDDRTVAPDRQHHHRWRNLSSVRRRDGDTCLAFAL
jgi:hypothetical protein